MAKWERKLDKILQDEKDKSLRLYRLEEAIREEIHGSKDISEEFVVNSVNKVCSDFNLEGSEIKSIEIKPLYKSSENAEFYWEILITVSGEFNGMLTLETGKGYTNTTNREDIFYMSGYKSTIRSFKEDKVCSHYKQISKYAKEKFVDIMMDKNIHLEYDDCYENYRIWPKEIKEFGSGIQGSTSVYNEERDYKKFKRVYDNLNKLHKCEDIEEFAEEHLYGVGESYTYEWTEYKL